MKRKLAIIFLAGCIAAGAFSGCSKNNAPVADASQNTNLADKVTDENSVEDSGNAYSSCLKAIDAIEDAKSATIDSELIFTMTYEGETRSMKQHFNLKRENTDDSKRLEYDLKATSTVEKGENAETDGDADKAENTENETNGYFSDGTLYQEIPQNSDVDSDNKEPIYLKAEAEYDEVKSYVLSMANYVADDITEEHVKTAAMEEKNGGTQYIYILDDEKMVSYMEDFMSYYMGLALSENETVEINYANISADLDPSGNLTDYTFSLDTVIKTDEGDIPFSYNIASKFSNIDSTSVKERSEDELSKYITEDEYMAQKSGGAESGTTDGSEPTGQKLSPEEMEEMGLDPELYDAEIITEAAK